MRLIRLQGQGPYAARLKKLDQDLKEVQKRINEKLGTFAAMVGRSLP